MPPSISAPPLEAIEQALCEAGISHRPVAVLDLDAFDRNAHDISQRAQGVPVRVASKSLRVVSLIRRAVEFFGNGILAYSLPEAEDLVDQGFTNIVVAYPTACVDSLKQLAQREDYRSQITLMIDSLAHASLLSEISAPYLMRGERIRVAVELDCAFVPLRNVHLGALRSPLFTPGQIAALADELARFDRLQVVGLMGYESQIAGTANGGHSPLRLATRALQVLSGKEVNQRRCAAVAELRKRFELEFVNGGGTGSLESTAQDPSITEVAAGSGLIGPASFDEFAHFQPHPALVLGFPVVRRPSKCTATILGGGWIASGPSGQDRSPKLIWPEGLSYAALEGAGEVQTPLIGRAAADLRVGDTVWVRHAKAGEPAEHINEYALYSQGQIVDLVPTYRGSGHAYI